MAKFIIYCTTSYDESAEVEAETEQEALALAEQNPGDYDWDACDSDYRNEYTT